jgi:predicted DCC family thiol-disulfide oxidoreductase YuxK
MSVVQWLGAVLAQARQAGHFQFAAIQGEVGGKLLADAGLRMEGLQTLLLVDGQRSWQHTDACACCALGWPWRLTAVIRLIPAALRDALYRDRRNRYHWFGKSEQCMMRTLLWLPAFWTELE